MEKIKRVQQKSGSGYFAKSAFSLESETSCALFYVTQISRISQILLSPAAQRLTHTYLALFLSSVGSGKGEPKARQDLCNLWYLCDIKKKNIRVKDLS